MKKRWLSILLIFIISVSMMPIYADKEEEILEYNKKEYAKYTSYPAVLEYYMREDNAANDWKTPEFKSLAEKITAGCTTEYEKAEAIFVWVAQNMWYGSKTTDKTYSSRLESILDTKAGVCADYATLATALLRAAGIPARAETGVTFGPAIGSHMWLFAYADGRWVYMDPTWGSVNVYDNGEYSPPVNYYRGGHFDSSLEMISGSRKLMPWRIFYYKPDKDVYAANIVIPEGYTEIGDNEFSGSGFLEKIVLPKTINDIRGAFNGCINLKEVVIPEGDLKSIGTRAFYMCTSLKEVNIPRSVVSIGSDAFSGCDSLVKLVIPPTVTEIADDAFGVVEFNRFSFIKGKVTSVHEKHYPKNLVIYGQKDSYAHRYAIAHKIKFSAINFETKK